jgi:hypothetical protein
MVSGDTAGMMVAITMAEDVAAMKAAKIKTDAV